MHKIQHLELILQKSQRMFGEEYCIYTRYFGETIVAINLDGNGIVIVNPELTYLDRFLTKKEISDLGEIFMRICSKKNNGDKIPLNEIIRELNLSKIIPD